MNLKVQINYEEKKEKIISDLENIKEKNKKLKEEFIKLEQKNKEEFNCKEKFLSEINKFKAIYNTKKKLIDLKSEILNKKMDIKETEFSKNLKIYKNFLVNFHNENNNIFTKEFKLDDNDKIKSNLIIFFC